MNVNRFSKIAAIASAPQITPIYFFIALFYAMGGTGYLFLGVSIAFAAIIPLLSIVVYTKLSKLDAFIKERNRRYPLFYTAMVSFVAGFIILRYVNAPFIITALMLAYALNSMLATMLNRYVDKVSVHTWNISGPAVAILYQFGVLAFFLALATALFVGISRILVRAHTKEEVMIAFLASIVLTYPIIFLLPLVLPNAV